MCNFSNVVVGHEGTMITQEVTCVSCGFRSGGITAKVVYLGHSVDGNTMMDCFSLRSTHKCPSCGETFSQYQEACGDGFFFSREAVEQKRGADRIESERKI